MKSILSTWTLTATLCIYNWLSWDSLPIRIFVIAFLMLVAVFTTKHLLGITPFPSNAEETNAGTTNHTAIPVLKQKYGKFYHLRLYWALAFFVGTTIISDVFSDITFWERLSWFAMAAFFVDGIYLCIVKFTSEKSGYSE